MTLSIEKCIPPTQLPPNSKGTQHMQMWHLLRPTISSRGSITYGVARELANIICPLVGQSPHHSKTPNTVQHIKEIKFESREVMASYVKALFTSVPVDPSINIEKQKYSRGPLLTKDQHVHTTNSYTSGILPQNTYFLFQDMYYEQVHGAAMGSPH